MDDARDPAVDLDTAINRAIDTARTARRARHPEQAVAILRGVAATHPASVAALVLLGHSHADLRHHDDAVAAFDRAIVLDPACTMAHVGRALALLGARRLREALASALQASALEPGLLAAWIALGRVCGQMDLVELAAKAFRKAAAIAPARADLKGLVLQQQMSCCDWSGLDALVEEIEAHVAAGEWSVSPFYWHAISTSSHSLQRAARLESDANPFEPVPAPPAASARPAAGAGRIRIGYVSGEFNTAANGLCIAGVLDAHAADAFDIVAFDNGCDDGTPLRRRIAGAFAEVVPVTASSDREFAAAVAARGIDVLVNLNGFFGNDRSAAFRLKPAPVQVNYLGCPGTMGAPYMDYIVADAVVLPERNARFFDEKIVRLPDTYFATDRARPIASRVFSRAECGLPEDAFVFCCFNMSHKILPVTFAAWMRILHAVPGSVLWLIDAYPAATRNLRAEAAARGIDPARLVFAKHAEPAEHLARHACADLFLDTLPYNAHTTAGDALWSGLPLLTLLGTTFPGRVAASLLAAVGLPELVTTAADEYEQRAIDLARHPAALERMRRTLAANRLTTPLFDTARYTRHLETAYRTMVERHRAGLPPVDITIERGPVA